MTAQKTEFLNMRVSPQTKRALKIIAARENRSMANSLEWLVADYVQRHQIQLPHPSSKRARTHVG